MKIVVKDWILICDRVRHLLSSRKGILNSLEAGIPNLAVIENEDGIFEVPVEEVGKIIEIP